MPDNTTPHQRLLQIQCLWQRTTAYCAQQSTDVHFYRSHAWPQVLDLCSTHQVNLLSLSTLMGTSPPLPGLLSAGGPPPLVPAAPPPSLPSAPGACAWLPLAAAEPGTGLAGPWAGGVRPRRTNSASTACCCPSRKLRMRAMGMLPTPSKAACALPHMRLPQRGRNGFLNTCTVRAVWGLG